MLPDLARLFIATAALSSIEGKSASNKMTFFEACAKSGTATNYIYKEIEKRFDEYKKSGLGEVKFLSGFLISAALFAFILKVAEESPNSRIIFVIYLLLVCVLIIRTWMVVRATPPSYEEIFMKSGSIKTILEKKTDEEWAKKIENHFLVALSYGKWEKIFRGLILAICLVFVVSIISVVW